MPKVDSMPIEMVDCEDEANGEWLRFVEKPESRGVLPEVVRGRYPGYCCWSKNESVEPVSTLSENTVLSERVLERIVDVEMIEPVQEFFFRGDRLLKPNSSKGGESVDDDSLGKPNSVGLVRLEEPVEASDSLLSSISSNLRSWAVDRICCGPASCD